MNMSTCTTLHDITLGQHTCDHKHTHMHTRTQTQTGRNTETQYHIICQACTLPSDVLIFLYFYRLNSGSRSAELMSFNACDRLHIYWCLDE
jgi:hypothetical protein